jgi:hypothetical protein
MTDTDFVLAQLQRGSATTMQLIRVSISERGCGLTPHSRVADLRRQGHDVRCERSDSVNGRPVYVYTLVEGAGSHPPVVVAGPGGAREIPAALPDVIPGQLELIA